MIGEEDMMDTSIAEYLDIIDRKFFNEEFDRSDHLIEPGIDRVYHKREFEITKFGMVDRFFMFHIMDTKLGKEGVRKICERMFSLSIENKIWIPRSMGSALITYPVFVSQGPTSSDLNRFFEGFNPKHYAAFEFPVLIDLSSNCLYYYQGTPIWGLVYYEGMRHEAREYLTYKGS